MGMFGDLDKLNKEQQAAAPQSPDSEQVQRTPLAPHLPTYVPLSPPLPKPSKAPVKQPRVQTARSTQPSEAEARPDTILNDKKMSGSKTVRTNERTKIRHSFDIFQDQLFELRDLAYERQRGSLQKVPLGDLVQEALDIYLAAQRRSK